MTDLRQLVDDGTREGQAMLHPEQDMRDIAAMQRARIEELTNRLYVTQRQRDAAVADVRTWMVIAAVIAIWRAL